VRHAYRPPDRPHAAHSRISMEKPNQRVHWRRQRLPAGRMYSDTGPDVIVYRSPPDTTPDLLNDVAEW